MSSLSNSWMSEAWMAAPRAERVAGSIAVGKVEGERMRVCDEKSRWRFCEMRGLWDVPPERIT